MSRALGLFAIGLVFGGLVGFVVAAGNGITFDGHDHASHTGIASMAHDMAHGTPRSVPAENAPEVAIELIRDPVEGFNLHLTTRNFTFTPAASGFEHVAGEGHAHVYVNGQKLGRLYGDWMHIAHLPQGEVTVKVTLNSNDHSTLAVAGAPIAASIVLTVE